MKILAWFWNSMLNMKEKSRKYRQQHFLQLAVCNFLCMQSTGSISMHRIQYNTTTVRVPSRFYFYHDIHDTSWFLFIVETDSKETGQDQKLTTSKKSTIFDQSSWNLVKRTNSMIRHFDQVLWWELKYCRLFISNKLLILSMFF